jgi:hypothetical protein
MLAYHRFVSGPRAAVRFAAYRAALPLVVATRFVLEPAAVVAARCYGAGVVGVTPLTGAAASMDAVAQHAATTMPGAAIFEWNAKAYAEFLNAKPRVVGGQTKDAKSGITLLDKDSNWLFSDQTADDSEHPTVLIQREWHDALWAYFKKNVAYQRVRFAVVGTPGIGKSVAINVMLHRLLLDADKFSNWSDKQLMQDADVAEYARAKNITTLSADDKRHLSAMKGRRYVVIILPKDHYTFVFDTVCQQMSAAIEERIWSAADILYHLDSSRRNTVVLHDLGQKPPVEEARRYTCVLFTSPSDDTKKYTEFLKDGGGGSGGLFYAPVYSDAEMQFVADNVWPEHKDKWKERADVCGNVPRLVFGSEPERVAWTRITDTKITLLANSSFDVCKQVLTNVHVASISDRLLVIGPKVETDGRIDYAAPTSNLRSVYVRNRIMNCINANTVAAAKEVLGTTSDDKEFERMALLSAVFLRTSRGRTSRRSRNRTAHRTRSVHALQPSGKPRWPARQRPSPCRSRARPITTMHWRVSSLRAWCPISRCFRRVSTRSASPLPLQLALPLPRARSLLAAKCKRSPSSPTIDPACG